MPLIVIEGVDGSGKRTQTNLLLDRLKKEGRPAHTLSFPQYGKKSAGPIEELLNGRYGAPDAVDPHVASLFYAVDRFDASESINKILASDSVLVLDRYATSNAAHQGGKITDENARKEYIEWISHIEYDIFKIPKPDLVIILHVPAHISATLTLQKPSRGYIEGAAQQDEVEKDLGHQKRAESCYLWLAAQHPDTYVVIECFENGALLSPVTIHERVGTR